MLRGKLPQPPRISIRLHPGLPRVCGRLGPGNWGLSVDTPDGWVLPEPMIRWGVSVDLHILRALDPALPGLACSPVARSCCRCCPVLSGATGPHGRKESRGATTRDWLPGELAHQVKRVGDCRRQRSLKGTQGTKRTPGSHFSITLLLVRVIVFGALPACL